MAGATDQSHRRHTWVWIAQVAAATVGLGLAACLVLPEWRNRSLIVAGALGCVAGWRSARHGVSGLTMWLVCGAAGALLQVAVIGAAHEAFRRHVGSPRPLDAAQQYIEEFGRESPKPDEGAEIQKLRAEIVQQLNRRSEVLAQRRGWAAFLEQRYGAPDRHPGSTPGENHPWTGWWRLLVEVALAGALSAIGSQLFRHGPL